LIGSLLSVVPSFFLIEEPKRFVCIPGGHPTPDGHWEMRSMLFFENSNWLSLGDWLVGSAMVLFKISLSDGWDGVLIPVSL
jgi:hypothetical protein